MTRAAVLAVDGGNSKTDVVLVAADGSLLAHVRGATSSPHRLGPEAAFAVLDGLVRDAVAATDGAVVLSEAGVADVAAVYLAGADQPREIASLSAAAVARRWARVSYVENDTLALLRAGTDSPDAVAVVCGAGINCVGVGSGGRIVRFPALGRISGDWGGGWQLGEQALWSAARDEDGRGPATALTRLVADHFGLPTAAAVGLALHENALAHDQLVELAPLVLRASADGDAVARSVVDRLADEVVLMATSALRRLDLLASSSTVVLGGGVLAADDPVLVPAVVAGLAQVAPLATARVVAERPVLGAALAGLDRVGADPAAHERLRAALAGSRAG